MTAPAVYFPVEAAPLRMAPRLRPFGTDFGNGAADAIFFQRDRDFGDYCAVKRSLGAGTPKSPLRLRAENNAEQEAHAAALSWAEATLASEQPGALAPPSPRQPVKARWEKLALAVQEDLVLVQRDAHRRDRVIGSHVCFPSAWRPEAIIDHGFRAIHSPVPGFAEREETAQSLVDAMIERGPYVRFVWTVTADGHLDHHPDHGHLQSWAPSNENGWLRVERQVTVPLPEVAGALFLIRTYRTPFAALGREQQNTLAAAIQQLPDDVAEYKGVDRAIVMDALDAVAAKPSRARGDSIS